MDMDENIGGPILSIFHDGSATERERTTEQRSTAGSAILATIPTLIPLLLVVGFTMVGIAVMFGRHTTVRILFMLILPPWTLMVVLQREQWRREVQKATDFVVRLEQQIDDLTIKVTTNTTKR